MTLHNVLKLKVLEWRRNNYQSNFPIISEALRETLSLSYPSYILALAMGAGKTILTGTIIATEFAMALEYPDNTNFVKNALVFAPGKTILGALKELSDIPYEKILPLRLYKEFITSVKFTYTRDGEKKFDSHNFALLIYKYSIIVPKYI